MEMKEELILKEIFDNISNGKVYGEYILNNNTQKRDLFWAVLYTTFDRKYIVWRYYGGSFNKHVLKDLKWILENIFECKPSEFIEKYVIEGEE